MTKPREPATVPTGAGYVGRFAPTPSGPLHFGSLLAALASCLEARVHGGRWFVRIEDIDPPRERPGAAGEIVAALEAYGFFGDCPVVVGACPGDNSGACPAGVGATGVGACPVVFQRHSELAHAAAIARLVDAGRAYYCDCSRKDLVEAELGAVYPGTCRDRHIPPGRDRAVRVRTDGARIEYVDQVQGPQRQVIEATSGDFVIRRRDGFVAYQLAVVVDDALQGVTDVVRGIDLMESTPRQIWLQQLLEYPTPGYAHIPVAVTADGQKLSKATHAAPLPLDAPGRVLCQALVALGQAPPTPLATAPLPEIWAWAAAHWDIARLRCLSAVPAPAAALAAGQKGVR